MKEKEFVEIKVPDYFCKDCTCKEQITEIAIKELINQS